jgi:HrpA-like RNA helicase
LEPLGKLLSRFPLEPTYAKALLASHSMLYGKSDHMILVSLYGEWDKVERGREQEWCHKNFAQSRALKQARNIKGQLQELLDRLNIATCPGFLHEHMHIELPWVDSLLPRLKEIDVKRLCGITDKVVGKRKERQEEGPLAVAVSVEDS